jgi:hypothetical protein
MLTEDIEIVELTVFQPRINNISTFEISKADLLFWGEHHVIPKAKMASEGLGDFHSGDWCKFCKVKYKCPKMFDEFKSIQNIAEKDSGFDSGFTQKNIADFIDDNLLLEIYNKADLVQEFIKSIKDYIYKEALNGKKWPGLKLVESRTNRIISDPENLILDLELAVEDTDELFTKKLIGLTALKKILGKKDFEAIVDPYLIKPKGTPTLVDNSDPRQEYSSALSDFDDDFCKYTEDSDLD